MAERWLQVDVDENHAAVPHHGVGEGRKLGLLLRCDEFRSFVGSKFNVP
jgi:hypothetical protein